MATLQSPDEFAARLGAGYGGSLQYTMEGSAAAVTANWNASQIVTMQKMGEIVLPSLPTGVTAFIPTRISAECQQSTGAVLFARLIDLGSLSLATPTFTDGSAMPTLTELGVSRVSASALYGEVTTAFNATPGSYSVSYTDQDGNAQTSASIALTASAAVGTAGPAILGAADRVRDITSATRTGGTTPTGVVKFWGLLPLIIIDLPSTAANGSENLIGPQSLNPMRLPGGAVIGVFFVGNTGAKTVFGEISMIGDS